MNSLTFQNWDAYTLQEGDGFLNETNYQTQDNAQNKRKQLQSQISQTRDYINGTVKPAVDTLQTHTIVSDDENITVTEVNNVTKIKLNVSPSGEATKAYVDAQDTANLAVANAYAVAQDVINLTSAQTYTNTKMNNKTILCLSQSEYEALETKDANTLYFTYED